MQDNNKQTLAICLAAVVLCCFSNVASANTATDNFSGYANNSFPTPDWLLRSWTFRVINGELKYTAKALETVQGIWLKVPESKDMSFTSTITVPNTMYPNSSQWLIAGIGLWADANDFWAVQLVQAPYTSTAGLFAELNEMRGGKWQAQAGREKVAFSTGGSFRWHFGTTYKMKIQFDVSGAVPVVGAYISHPTNGTVFWSMGYKLALANESIMYGKPFVRVGGLYTQWDNAEASWSSANEVPMPSDFPAYTTPLFANCKASGVSSQATGFFRVEKTAAGKWWFMDPLGKPFYVVGIDHVNYNVFYSSRTQRADYNLNAQKKYGTQANWTVAQIARLKKWGFNTLAAGHSSSLEHQGLAHIVWHDTNSFSAQVSYIANKTTWTGFPNVFDPQWPNYLSFLFSDLYSAKNDPWVVGHFVDNEIQWWGAVEVPCHSSYCMFNEVWRKPRTHTAKQALVKFLADNIPANNFTAVFYANWNISGIHSASDLLDNVNAVPPVGALGVNLTTTFLRIIAEKYFSTVSSALKAADPNHLYLCNRFPGSAPPILDIVAKYCDVVTFNYYPTVEPFFGVPKSTMDTLRTWYTAAGSKPMMITEWSFPGLDALVPSVHGAGMRVDTQQQRAKCFKYLQSAFMGTEFIVGDDYFMFVDEPAEGISDGFPEDSNYGLINVNDTAWGPITNGCMEVNPSACAFHEAGSATTSWISYGYQPSLDVVSPTNSFSPNTGRNVTTRGMMLSLTPGANVFSMMTYKGLQMGLLQVSVMVHLVEQNKDAWIGWSTFNFTSVIGSSSTGWNIRMAYKDPYSKISMELQVILPAESATAQPWVGIRLLGIVNNRPNTTVKVSTFALTFKTNIGGDKTGDIAMPAAPFSNYWQRGNAMYDPAFKAGLGNWYIGKVSSGVWSGSLSMTEDITNGGSVSITVPTGGSWAREPSAAPLLFFYPYKWTSSTADPWTQFNTARSSTQNEVALSASSPLPILPSGSSSTQLSSSLGLLLFALAFTGLSLF